MQMTMQMCEVSSVCQFAFPVHPFFLGEVYRWPSDWPTQQRTRV